MRKPLCRKDKIRVEFARRKAIHTVDTRQISREIKAKKPQTRMEQYAKAIEDWIFLYEYVTALGAEQSYARELRVCDLLDFIELFKELQREEIHVAKPLTITRMRWVIRWGRAARKNLKRAREQSRQLNQKLRHSCTIDERDFEDWPTRVRFGMQPYERTMQSGACHGDGFQGRWRNNKPHPPNKQRHGWKVDVPRNWRRKDSL